MGVTCIDYENFFSQVNKQPLQTYLNGMEDDTHGIFHFTFGGVGGDQAIDSIDKLRNTYGFSYSNIVALAISAQPFFKKYLAVLKQNPVNCTTHPWQNEMLVSSSAPGEFGGPSCDFAGVYYDTEDQLDNLISDFFLIDPDDYDPVVKHIQSFGYSDKSAVMKIVANLFPFDGDLAGSGAGIFYPFHIFICYVFSQFFFILLFLLLFYYYYYTKYHDTTQWYCSMQCNRIHINP